MQLSLKHAANNRILKHRSTKYCHFNKYIIKPRSLRTPFEARQFSVLETFP